jgi:aminopeptidase N
MKARKIQATAFVLLTLFSACGIFGIHFHLHNPRFAGKYPRKTAALELLGNQDSKFRTCFDVNYYYLTVRFGQNLKKDKGITGTVGMKATVKQDFDTLQLDLRRNMQLFQVYSGSVGPNGMEIGEELNFFRKENAFFVIFPATQRKGTAFCLVIEYGGVPAKAKRPPWSGGFVREEDDLKNPWWGVSCETEGASLWWPCKDVVNDEPDSADIDLWVPEGIAAISNGRKVDAAKRHVSSAPGEKRPLVPWCWHVSSPINLYDISFYLGRYKLLKDEYISSVTHDRMELDHYVLEQHYEKARQQFPQAKEVLKFYEETFGPYAFYNDGYKLVESPYAGMEHQSAIAYGAGFKNTAWQFDYIILHETAHEWWGNAVTATDLGDAWLHEGFATYCEALYVEKKFGRDASLSYIRMNAVMIRNKRPVSRPYGIRYFDYHDEDIYNKGAWILHSLRYATGSDSLFFGILREFYSRFQYRNATTHDLEMIVNEKTGKDFGWFFRQYCYNRLVPELEYCRKGKTIYYRWNPACSDSSFGHLPVRFSEEKKRGGSWNYYLPIIPSATAIKTGDAPPVSADIVFETNAFLFRVKENKKLERLSRSKN